MTEDDKTVDNIVDFPGIVLNTTDPTKANYAGPCSRCGGGVPNDLMVGEYPGALSRYDNKSYICSSCGTAEAMYQFFHKGQLPPLDQFIG